MKRESVDSSMISSFGYDTKTATLEIEFNSGAVWQYEDVSASVYKKMKAASSFGRFFLDYIKGGYAEFRVR